MAYEIILDNEVDPGSPITNSLLRRLRDNPYAVIPDTALDGSLGTKGRTAPGTSTNPAVNTVWDNPAYPQISPTNTDPLIVTTAPFAVCPREARLAFSPPIGFGAIGVLGLVQPINIQTYIYYDGVHADSYQLPAYASLLYTDGIPTKLRLKCCHVQGVYPYHYTNGSPSPVISLALASADSVDIDLGAGFVDIFRHVSGAYTVTISASATVDLDAGYIALRINRSNAANARGTIGVGPYGAPNTGYLPVFSYVQLVKG